VNGLPEITEIGRLTLKPGDRLIARTDDVLTAQSAADLTEMLRVRLALPDGFPFIVLGRGMTKAESKALVSGRDVAYVPYHHREAMLRGASRR